MNRNLYSWKEISDFREKIRILSKKYDKNVSEKAKLEQYIDQSSNRIKNIEKENESLKKQIKKFESIIEYAESLFDKLSIQHDINRRKKFKK